MRLTGFGFRDAGDGSSVIFLGVFQAAGHTTGVTSVEKRSRCLTAFRKRFAEFDSRVGLAEVAE